MNRVQDLYEIAITFNSLPHMCKYIIGTHFIKLTHKDYTADEDELAKKVFIEGTKKFTEFKQMVKKYDEQRQSKNRKLH